ncbi:14676_t:CDS:2 [Funneliformis geosporum]|uniref:14676_t:CDS:1 n=1 Tax=Funneliformis geosporum TaxID=1117311 RepID=A0A9W4SN57_9GLOM|nr:14676_t:CDS:2 [Funneliformis geosporum]
MPPEDRTEVEQIFRKDDKHHADISSSNDHLDIHSASAFLKSSFEFRTHLVDLDATPKRTLPQKIQNVPLIYPSITYLIYFGRVIEHLFLTILFDWTTIIAHPINFVLMFVLFPLATVILFFLECILRFVSFVSQPSINEPLLKNWSKLIPSIRENIQRGIEVLDASPLYQCKYKKNFDLDQAQTLLFLLNMLSERDEAKVKEAFAMLRDMQGVLKKEPDDINNENVKNIFKVLIESEANICKQLKEFDIEFTSLSELNSIGGPYAGMFWSEKRNFIVVAFKGTNPTNFSDWLINFTFQRTDARSYLFGEIHEGFYNSLFPIDEYDSARLDRRCPATRIIEAVHKRAKIIRERNAKDNDMPIEDTSKVSVWITGHSLGGALATIFYSRLLKSPQSLNEHCLIRDGITFASPSIGDSDFAAEFSSLSNRSPSEYKTMWRIVCDNDIVPRVPPGHHYPRLRRFTSKVHILNYFHIGDEARFYQDGSKPMSMRNLFDDDKDFYFIEKGLDYNWKSLFGFYDPFDHKPRKKSDVNPRYDIPLYNYEKWFPSFILNHMSHRYLVALEKSRPFFKSLDDISFVV